MNVIAEVCITGIITALCVMILRQDSPGFAVLASIVGGVLILFIVIDAATEVFAVIDELMQKSSVGGALSTILFKIVGISYLTDFSAGIIEESGSKPLAEKVVLGGKIIILAASLPIFKMLMELISNLLQ